MAFEIVLFTDLTGQFYHNKAQGAYSLASTLRRAGFSVMVVDYFQRYLRDKKKLAEVLRKVVGKNTLFVGFSSTFYTAQLQDDKDFKNWFDFDNGLSSVWPSEINTIKFLISVIKKINPLIKIVYGGIKATRPDLTTSGIDIDYVIQGYAEITAVKLAQHLKSGSEIKTRQLGSVQLVDYDTLASEYQFAQHQTQYEAHDILLPGETLALETSRGCMYNCTFCDFPLRNRKRDNQDYHISDTNLREYFMRNYELAGITNYMITDDTFNETTNKLQRFRDVVVSTGLPLRFMCFVRIDLFEKYPEQIQLLKEAGVISIWIGIESLNAATNKAIGKPYSKEFLEKQLANVKQQTGPDFRIYASFIVGLPHDTPETVEDWVNWAIDTQSIDCIQLAAFGLSDKSTPWPSEISKNIESFGYKKTSEITWVNHSWRDNEAVEFAQQWQQKIWDSGRNRLAAFHLFGAMSLGYGFDEIKDISVNNLPFDDIKRRIQRQFEQYHQRLISM